MPKPPYQPRTPPVILVKTFLDLMAQEKRKGAIGTMAFTFLEHQVDLEELDNSPKFQEMAETVRLEWNRMVERQQVSAPDG